MKATTPFTSHEYFIQTSSSLQHVIGMASPDVMASAVASFTHNLHSNILSVFNDFAGVMF